MSGGGTLRPTLDQLRAKVEAKQREPKRTRVRCINCGTAWYVDLTPEQRPDPKGDEFGWVAEYECSACDMMVVTQAFWTASGFGSSQVGENTGGCGKIELRKRTPAPRGRADTTSEG